MTNTREEQRLANVASATMRGLSQAAGGGKTPYLLTPQKQSAKLSHNADVTDEYEQVICYMLPHRLAGDAWRRAVGDPEFFGLEFTNLCVSSSRGCRASCLHNAGRLGMADTAKLVRSALYAYDGGARFWHLMDEEIASHKRRVEAKGKKLVVRVNGTSDIHVPVSLVEKYPDVVFFDYTKHTDVELGWSAVNRYLVYSATERTADDEIDRLISAGHNVVIPFQVKRGHDLPQTYLGHAVIDGDKHDLRFLDPQGVVVGLRHKLAKGHKTTDHRGFIRPVPVSIG